MVLKPRFRRATFEDWPILLEWRNDEKTRSGSFHSEPLEAERHKEWLRDSLSNPNRALFVAETPTGEAAGTVRLDKTGDLEWELSWAVSPSFRGRGFGKEMVRAAVQLVDGSVIARIKASNTASIQVALYAGFQLKEKGDHLIYALTRPTREGR